MAIKNVVCIRPEKPNWEDEMRVRFYHASISTGGFVRAADAQGRFAELNKIEVDVMGLPVKFNNVHYYRISGRYIFAGDLFIARRTLYFFPEVDLAEQREKATEYLPDHFALAVLAIVYLAQKLNSYVSRNDLWEEGMPDEQFQKKANAYIEELKEERRRKGFSESLPLPTVVSVGEISDIRLSPTGRLCFLAQSDNHDFNIGFRRKKAVA